MKATVEVLNPVQRRVNVEISSEEVNKAFEGAFRKLQQRARVQGFRPGKAPLNVIKKLYGGSVTSEVAESLINTHLFGALNEQTIRPIASPMVEAKDVPAMDKAYAFSAVVDVMPELTFDDYKGVPVQREAFAVKDETVDRELYMLRRRNAKTRDVEPGQPAAKGMLASISHTAKVDGEDIPNMNVNHMTVLLGEGELFEGLESEILGMTGGAKKKATVKLPESYGDPALAGKDVEFDLTLHEVKHMDLPQLDDEFAKDLDLESADQLKTQVRASLEQRASEISRQRLEGALLDKVLEMHPFEVPPAMVDQVIDSMIGELGFKSEDERKRALQDQELRKGFLEQARRRTQNTLILWHVTQKEKLQVTEDEVKSRVEQTITSMGLSDPRQLPQIRQRLEPRVRENMIFEKAMNFLIDNASLTDVSADI